MPAPKTPHNILDLTGRFKHDPGRLADRTPPPEDNREISLTPPDARVISYEEAWASILEMAPPGMLRRRDTQIVAECARVFMVHHNIIALSRIEGRVLPSIDNNTHRQLIVSLGKLGLTPTDCNHVSVPKAAPVADEFD